MQEDVVQVPSAAEIADSLDRAQRALSEIEARTVLDDAAEDTDRAAELNRWHTDDTTTDSTEHRAEGTEYATAGNDA